MPAPSMSTLPEELLIIIFTILVRDGSDIQGAGPRALALLTVCRQWNFLAMPLFYWSICIDSFRHPTCVSGLAASLIRGRARGGARDWSRYVRVLCLESSPPEELEDIFLLFDHLESIYMHEVWTPALAICSRTCSTTSLLCLDIWDTQRDEYAYIGKFTSLTSIEIYTADTGAVLHGFDGWDLPTLEHLVWEEPGLDNLPMKNLEVARFLSKCDFPKLQEADLRIEICEEDGPEHILRFLQVHPTIDKLTILVLPVMYPIIIPAVRIRQLNLHHCGEVESCLLRYVSPMVKRLDLPVFLDDIEEWRCQIFRHPPAPVTEPLEELLTRPGNVAEVHLALGHRWGKNIFETLNQIDAYRPFKLGFDATTHPDVLDGMARIYNLVVQLQAASRYMTRKA